MRLSWNCRITQAISVSGVFVNVNGSDFYIEKNLVSRAESQALCESLNMTLISFETADKWTMISNWTFANGIDIKFVQNKYGFFTKICFFKDYQYDWFWTGGIKDVADNVWKWESTGAEISDFFWQRDQPSLVNPVMNVCIDFVTAYQGWDDDYCAFFILNTLCQNKWWWNETLCIKIRSWNIKNGIIEGVNYKLIIYSSKHRNKLITNICIQSRIEN